MTRSGPTIIALSRPDNSKGWYRGAGGIKQVCIIGSKHNVFNMSGVVSFYSAERYSAKWEYCGACLKVCSVSGALSDGNVRGPVSISISIKYNTEWEYCGAHV